MNSDKSNIGLKIYDSAQFINLLELENKTKSFSSTCSLAYIELMLYKDTLTGYIHWLRRENYFKLLDNYLTNKTDRTQFIKEFYKILNKCDEKVELLLTNIDELKKILPKLECIDFGYTVNDIELLCQEEDLMAENTFVYFLDSLNLEFEKYR